ncbi:GIY-YIG nuclease superfamily protein [compost metagenome]
MFRPHYIYILRSQQDGTYYKGYTENYLRRLAEHNNGKSEYTSSKIPWDLIYVEEHPDKRSALIREKKLKKCKKEYSEWLVLQSSNVLIISSKDAVPVHFCSPNNC